MNTALATTYAPHILIVEDDEIVAEQIQIILSSVAYRVTRVSDCSSAWGLLQQTQPDYSAVLLDRNLPDMDGLALLKKIKSLDKQIGSIPVIMATSVGDADSILEGLEAGAYYYLSKPLHPELLLAVVKSAIKQFGEYKGLRLSLAETEQALGALNEGTLSFKAMKEVTVIAAWLSLLSPVHLRDRLALGLHELLSNAIEHGNLGVCYEEKCHLLTEGLWTEEIRRLESLPENQAKQVKVHFERDAQDLSFTITDQGEGFDWNPYLEFDPERLFDPNGRGIATARIMGFDCLEYLGKGNIVKATLLLKPASSEN